MGQEAEPLIPIDFADRIGRRRRKQSKHSPSQPRKVCPLFFPIILIDAYQRLTDEAYFKPEMDQGHSIFYKLWYPELTGRFVQYEQTYRNGDRNRPIHICFRAL